MSDEFNEVEETTEVEDTTYMDPEYVEEFTSEDITDDVELKEDNTEEVSEENLENNTEEGIPFKLVAVIWIICVIVFLGLLAYNKYIKNAPAKEDKCTNYINNEALKPVLYLYPEIESRVHVYLTADDMTTTWPKANLTDENEYHWNVIAEPDGTIIQDNYEYSYIFWEATDNIEYDFTEGFCVKGEDTAEFLRTTLSQIGLTPKEYNEFIVFWTPKMQNNEYNLISFKGLDSTDLYNEEYPLDIVDENGNRPNVHRIYMVWKASDYVDIEPQTFVPFDRDGFTAVEWGGTEIGGNR